MALSYPIRSEKNFKIYVNSFPYGATNSSSVEIILYFDKHAIFFLMFKEQIRKDGKGQLQ